MQLFKNNAYSTVAASLASGGLTLTVATGHGDRFPVVAGADFALVTLQDASNNIEIVKVTARGAGSDAMTIVRAQEGTTARAWNIGDIVELRLTAAGLAPLQVYAGAATAAAMRAVLDVPTRTGGDASGTWGINITGNAGTATKLDTARALTIGDTAKNFDGSAAVSWTIAEIGAADKDDTVNLTGNQTVAGVKTFSSNPVVPGINGGQLAGMRNKIINGKMEIAQRGTSFTVNGYGLDRWIMGSASDAAITLAQVADAPADNEFRNSLRVTVGTADASIGASQYMAIGQTIEGYNARDLIGRTFALSFRVRSSKTGTHCVAFKSSTADRTYVIEYTVNAANTWETKSMLLVGGLITAGTWDWSNGRGLEVTFALAAGSTFQATAGAWQAGNFVATANQVNCLDTVGNIFAITGVQLEVGTQATPFEHRPIGTELALCQRYYEYGDGGDYQTHKLRESDGLRRLHIFYRVAKRAVPTVTLTGATANGGAAAPTVGAWSVSHFRVDADAGGTTTSVPAFATWTSEAEL